MAWMGGGISSGAAGPPVPAGRSLPPTLPAASTAGTLLVADIRSDATPSGFTAPAGWAQAAVPSQSGLSPRTEIWYYPNNPGGITHPTFTINPASIDSTPHMTDWANVATRPPFANA